MCCVLKVLRLWLILISDGMLSHSQGPVAKNVQIAMNSQTAMNVQNAVSSHWEFLHVAMWHSTPCAHGICKGPDNSTQTGRSSLVTVPGLTSE